MRLPRRSPALRPIPEAKVAVTAAELPEKALTGELSRGYLALLTEVFDGVHTMSPSIRRSWRARRTPALPPSARTKSNSPSISAQRTRHHRGNEEGIRASGIRARLYDDAAQLLPRVAAQARRELVGICERIFKEQNGHDMSVEPVHAGLECGSFSSANPALDIISIGPDILDIHSTRETLVLDTVYGCDTLIRAILKEIADKKA